MAKLLLTIELDYDADLHHGDDPEGRAWFFDEILSGDLVLHSNEIGDAVGMVTVKHVQGGGLTIKDFLELYDAAHAVIDHMQLYVDRAEYNGSMNAVQNFREIATRLRWKHDAKVPYQMG